MVLCKTISWNMIRVNLYKSNYIFTKTYHIFEICFTWAHEFLLCIKNSMLIVSGLIICTIFFVVQLNISYMIIFVGTSLKSTTERE